MRLNIGRFASSKFKSIVMYVASFALVFGSVSFALPEFLGQVAHAIASNADGSISVTDSTGVIVDTIDPVISEKVPVASPTPTDTLVPVSNVADATLTSELNVADATPIPELNAADATPTSDLNAVDATPTPDLNVADATPTPDLNVADATPTPDLNVADATPIPELNAADATLTPDLNVADAAPTPVDNLSPPADGSLISPEPSATLTTPSKWTFEKVELNKEYVAPQNSEVKLTFTKLPSPAGNIKIEEITLTQEQIQQTGSLSDKAYDITSDMTDGSFSYNLSLPIPEASKGKAVEVKFAEELSNIGTAEKVENTLTKTDISVSVNSLDHFTIFFVTDQTPTAPLSSPDSSAEPRYISGFGLDNTYTIFYEDRNDVLLNPTTPCPFGNKIYFNQTTSGPLGLSATGTATNICDTHFTAKHWPITIGTVTYAYRAWGSGSNNGTHNFYVSNDLINWTPINSFTFDPPSDGIIYGFHDIVQLNGHYIGWVESADSHTYIVRSDNGDEHWTVIAKVGGSGPTDLPLNLDLAPGINGPKPSGNFVLIELDGQLTYAKLYLAGDYSGAYMAINQAAAQATTPALKEAAFMDPANWTWRDGTTGEPGLANTVIANTKVSGGHDVREGWTVPMSGYHSDYVFLYTAEYATGAAKGLGYLVAISANPITNPATGRTSTGATVNGTNGAFDASNTSFWWGPSSAGPFTACTSCSSQFPSGWTHDAGLGAKTAGGSFNKPLTGLTPSTQYYFVVWSLVAGTWYPGEILNFTTAPASDTTAPVITLFGSPLLSLIQGQTFVDDGAKTDDGSLVVVTGSVNTAIVGTYIITYKSTDAAGNIAKPVTRTVIVNAAPAVVLGVTTAGTGGGTEIPVDNTIPGPSDTNQTTPEILGTKTTNDNLSNSATIAATGNGWSIFGLMWYWWLLILAAIASGWWIISAAIRRNHQDA